MIENYFIAGTDSCVGKTYVTCALLRSLCEQGINAMGFKPVACGDRTEARDIRNAVGQPTYKLESINPIYLRTLAEPIMAAEMERKPIEKSSIVHAYEQLAAEHSTVLVDGCGPWETPLAPGVSMADVAAELDLPVILVVNNRPGAAGLCK
ncbi:MAG: dethiobiotin synthase, partial [Akkermansia sp.]|nr:dethiobiotin synthase [Akkermansia sp.]